MLLYSSECVERTILRTSDVRSSKKFCQREGAPSPRMRHTGCREETGEESGGPQMTDNGAPEPTAPDTIVLIHGLWVTSRS